MGVFFCHVLGYVGAATDFHVVVAPRACGFYMLALAAPTTVILLAFW